jgi:hypothetical protein
MASRKRQPSSVRKTQQFRVITTDHTATKYYVQRPKFDNEQDAQLWIDSMKHVRVKGELSFIAIEFI